MESNQRSMGSARTMDVSTSLATTYLAPLRYKKSRPIWTPEGRSIIANSRAIFGKVTERRKNLVSLSSFLEEFSPCSCATHLLFLASMFHLLYEEGLEGLYHGYLAKTYIKQGAFCKQLLTWGFQMAKQ